MKALVGAACVVAAILAQGSVTLADVTCKMATADEIEAVRATLDGQLLDAESARFKDVCVVDAWPGAPVKQYYCGLINAKNRMGGYNGYVEFGTAIGAKMAVIVEGNDPKKLAWRKGMHCTMCGSDCSDLTSQ